MYIQKRGVKLSVVRRARPSGWAQPAPLRQHASLTEKIAGTEHSDNSFFSGPILLVIQKNELLRVLHAEHELSDHFIACMLAHNIRVEEDLIDQLFNSSEKCLA
jgi:CRP/FNR family transcriptional regulator, cyclic AMP receptor protein